MELNSNNFNKTLKNLNNLLKLLNVKPLKSRSKKVVALLNIGWQSPQIIQHLFGLPRDVRAHILTLCQWQQAHIANHINMLSPRLLTPHIRIQECMALLPHEIHAGDNPFTLELSARRAIAESGGALGAVSEKHVGKAGRHDAEGGPGSMCPFFA
jgi:hypothetical protein